MPITVAVELSFITSVLPLTTLDTEDEDVEEQLVEVEKGTENIKLTHKHASTIKAKTKTRKLVVKSDDCRFLGGVL
jgi:hypothetical protein